MKCSAGVAVAGCAVLLGSVITFFIGCGMVYLYASFIPSHPMPADKLPPGYTQESLRVVGLVMSGVVLLMTFLGGATGIGLFQLWRWARYSIIIWGAFLIFVGAMAALVILIVPLPAPNPEIMTGVRVFGGVLYGSLAALGLYFVLFFTRRKVAEQFRTAESAASPSLRPLSITVIAWFFIVGSPSCLLCVFGKYPAVLLGMVLTGSTAMAIYVSYTALNLLIGLGLLRYKMVAYWGAVGVYCLGFINVLLLMIPSVWTRYWNAISSISPVYGQSDGRWMLAFTVAMVAVTVGIPLYFLLTRRKRFVAAQQLLSAQAQVPSTVLS